MRIAGRLQLILRAGFEPEHIPAHLDVLCGAGHPMASVDGGRVDRALRRGGAFRASAVYASRRSLLRAGKQNTGYADDEHALGFSRTLRVELRDTDQARDVIAALRDLGTVETVRPETVARTNVSIASFEAPRVDGDEQ